MGQYSWSGVESNGWSRRGAWLARAVLTSLVLGCGDGLEQLSPEGATRGAGHFEDSASDADARGAVDVLAEMHIDHFTITFLGANEGPETDVSVAVGANCRLALPCDRRDPVTELRQRHEPTVGRLTHLELFQALAPGVSPPAALLASHALEAFDAGRDDDRTLDIEPLVPRLSGSERSPLPIATVAQLSVDGANYWFRAAGSGPDALVFVTESDASEELNALTRLAITYGDLTLLETFLALAPDAEPPLAVVATHPREIERMGTRADDAVRYDLRLPPAR